jgi:hypothetical protein
MPHGRRLTGRSRILVKMHISGHVLSPAPVLEEPAASTPGCSRLFSFVQMCSTGEQPGLAEASPQAPGFDYASAYLAGMQEDDVPTGDSFAGIYLASLM